MERDSDKTAFHRAWSYLNYKPAAKWSALAAAAGTSVLAVVLLFLLWLFADLMITRGQIPSYRELPIHEQVRFQKYWDGLARFQMTDKALESLRTEGVSEAVRDKLSSLKDREPESRDRFVDDLNAIFAEDEKRFPTAEEEKRFQNLVLAHALVLDQGRAMLRNIGLPNSDLASATSLALQPLEKQALAWRAYVFHVIHVQAGRAAGVLVLPTLRELPVAEQEQFLAAWARMPGAERESLAEELGLEKQLLRPDPATPQAKQIVWLASLYQQFTRDSSEGGDFYTAALLKAKLLAAAQDAEPTTDPESYMLADRGILSLIVRQNIHSNLYSADASLLARFNPYQAAGPMLGTVAWWNPWMWKYGDAQRPTFLYYLIGLLVLALLVALLRGMLMFLTHLLSARATIQAATRLRRSVYHHTFRLGTLAVRALGPGEAVTIFTRHTEAVHDALYTSLAVLFAQPITFALLLATALVIHPLLALAFLLCALLIWLVGGQVVAHFRHQGKAASKKAAEHLTLIRESLMLMRLVKVYLMELFNQSRVERQLARYAGAQLHRYRGEAVYKPVLFGLGLVAALVLLFFGGLITLQGHLEVASALTLVTALVCLYWPLHAWLENRKVLRRGRESAQAIFAFLDRPREVGQVVGAEFLPPLGKELEFDNVSLREPGSGSVNGRQSAGATSGGRMLLEDVTLTIKAGERVGIVGADDLAKYALVYLIPRFLDPTAGEIRMDQHNLRWVTLDSLRAEIALVMQHNLVFHDTVGNNIGCGDPAYTLPQIIEAAKIAHAHHFIQKLPKGYETAIGELGHPLAVSEQFRIALARAILRDPALLIVEEPSTPMDEETKSLLDDTFTRILPGRTAIFLPHRISTLKACDRLLLLHNGRLEAASDHRSLLSNNQLYRHLHYLEFNEVAE